MAERDGILAASVAYLPPGASDTRRFPPEWASIRVLAVRPSHRGRDIGRLLTEECIRHARQNVATEIDPHTGKPMKAARTLYERIGFRARRELPSLSGVPYRVYSLKLKPET